MPAAVLRYMKLSRVCPICGERAVSPHHITPRAAGGSSSPRNTAWLCGRCHDIVEAVYDNTGVLYCPALVRAIQRELGVNGVDRDRRAAGRARLPSGLQEAALKRIRRPRPTVWERCRQLRTAGDEYPLVRPRKLVQTLYYNKGKKMEFYAFA